MSTKELPITKLPQRKRFQLHRSACQPPIYITVEGHEYDPYQQAIVYIIETGIQNGTVVQFRSQKIRYSVLENFDRIVRGKIKNLNPFPGKKYFGNFNEKFLQEREIALQNYLANFNLNSELIHAFEFLVENQMSMI
jgi:hypothetical protein